MLAAAETVRAAITAMKKISERSERIMKKAGDWSLMKSFQSPAF